MAYFIFIIIYIPIKLGGFGAIFHTAGTINPNLLSINPVIDVGYTTLALGSALAYINENGMESVDDLEKYTVSSLNLIILFIEKSSTNGTIYYKNFYRGTGREDYLKMYNASMPGGIAVISSTLMEYGISGAVPVNGTGLMKLENE